MDTLRQLAQKLDKVIEETCYYQQEADRAIEDMARRNNVDPRELEMALAHWRDEQSA